jgi:hypothetical protein
VPARAWAAELARRRWLLAAALKKLQPNAPPARIGMPTVSLDTVYQTLWMLNDLGLITTLGPHRESVRFDANLENLHHYVCMCCGLVRNLESAQLNTFRIPDAVKGFGSVVAARVFSVDTTDSAIGDWVFQEGYLCQICASFPAPSWSESFGIKDNQTTYNIIFICPSGSHLDHHEYLKGVFKINPDSDSTRNLQIRICDEMRFLCLITTGI